MEVEHVLGAFHGVPYHGNVQGQWKVALTARPASIAISYNEVLRTLAFGNVAPGAIQRCLVPTSTLNYVNNEQGVLH